MDISCLCCMLRWPGSRALRLATLCGLLASGGAGATPYVWPIGNSSTPDAMNTSFGSRVNFSKWDFHDGIDLPGACGTEVHAVAAGTVVAFGDASLPTWHSRHVMIKVDDASQGTVYVYYFHLQKYASNLVVGAPVGQGDVVGNIGMDDATYCHLHIEFRKGGSQQASSYHPLHFLPYSNTANFTAPTGARFNRQSNGQMAARLVFGASSKLEGDLSRVEVDLKNGATVLATRSVDVDNKSTVNEGNDDGLEFVNDIALEGYQSSDMVKDGRTDLQYGVVVRNLPANCDTLVARVYDLGNNLATSAPASVPNQTAVEQSLDFEDGATAPPGWVARTGSFTGSGTGAATSVANDTTVAHGGTHSLLSTDSDSGSSQQQAAIEYNLDANRFEWKAESWIQPGSLNLVASAKQVYLLCFLDAGGTNLSVSGRLYRDASGSILAGIAARKPDGTATGLNGTQVITTGPPGLTWTLRLLRVATRETTAVLYLNGSETTRLSWDSTGFEPRKVRIGVGQSYAQVIAVLSSDDVLVTERTF